MNVDESWSNVFLGCQNITQQLSTIFDLYYYALPNRWGEIRQKKYLASNGTSGWVRILKKHHKVPNELDFDLVRRYTKFCSLLTKWRLSSWKFVSKLLLIFTENISVKGKILLSIISTKRATKRHRSTWWWSGSMVGSQWLFFIKIISVYVK